MPLQLLKCPPCFLIFKQILASKMRFPEGYSHLLHLVVSWFLPPQPKVTAVYLQGIGRRPGNSAVLPCCVAVLLCTAFPVL